MYVSSRLSTIAMSGCSPSGAATNTLRMLTRLGGERGDILLPVSPGDRRMGSPLLASLPARRTAKRDAYAGLA